MNPANDDNQKRPIDSQRIEDILRDFLNRRVRALAVSILNQEVVLNGYCDSFHTKQMAQEIVLQQTGLRVAANYLVVEYLPAATLHSDQREREESKHQPKES